MKADLLHETLDWPRVMGEVRYYDPTGAVGLVGGRDRRDGHRLQGRRLGPGREATPPLCSVARAWVGGMEDAGFWYANAEKLLALVAFAAATTGA